MKGPSGTGPARGLGVFWSALLITFLAWPASAVTITVPAVPKDVSTNATQTQLRGLQGSFVSGKVSAAGLASPAAPPPAAGPSLHRLWRLFRQVLGYFVLACGVAFWLYWVPTKLYNEHENFLAEKLEGRSFSMYLAYRFNFWMDSEGLSAMGIILFVGILSLLTAGAFLYAFFLDESPVTGLWMCFVWASAASVDPQAPAIMGFVGILTTLGGLILLAVLLTTISDYFAKQVQASKAGRDPVVEGGHLLVLGHSVQTKQLLEEFAICEADDKPTTVVILSNQPKQEVEDEIAAMNTNLGDLKLVVRSGKCCDKTDLWKVGADCAARIVIPENPKLSQDESDASQMGVLLTLKGQGKSGWPNNGYVALCSCISTNCEYMQELYPDKSFIITSETIGRMMVQGVQDQGLCSVFNQLTGFSGDEFYVSGAEDLGVVGKSFLELPFWFPVTVPLGVVRHGEYLLNPDKSMEIQQDDSIILLADDDDAVQPVESSHFDYARWAGERKPATFKESNPNDGETISALICNLNARNCGCAILAAMDSMSGKGSQVDLYGSLSEEETCEIVSNAQRKWEQDFKNIEVRQVYSAPSDAMTAMYRLRDLPLETYDYIILLANTVESVDRADEQTVAMVLQMQSLLAERDEDKSFQPLVEICTQTAEEQLSAVGIQNMCNSTLLVSKALAMVAISEVNYGVLKDILSPDGNQLDIMDLKDYLAEGETLPTFLTFAEAAAIVNRAVKQVLIGWSEDGEYIINPKSKLVPRPWSAEDSIVVIKDTTATGPVRHRRSSVSTARGIVSTV